MANDPNWIEHAHLHKGAFGKKAKAAGTSTAEFAEEKAEAPGKLGKQARLAQSLAGLRKVAK